MTVVTRAIAPDESVTSAVARRDRDVTASLPAPRRVRRRATDDAAARYDPPMPTKPEVTIPTGAPPTDLVAEDLVAGTGDEATAGSTVDVHYVGVAWSTQRQFDASWDRGKSFSFPLGAGRVIRGWDDGVAGMRVGGRRRLTIPPQLGYGDRGAGGDIKPGETLVFVVDLLAVR